MWFCEINCVSNIQYAHVYTRLVKKNQTILTSVIILREQQDYLTKLVSKKDAHYNDNNLFKK